MNVLLVDDHPMVSSGLATIIEETGRFTVAGQANTLSEAKHFIETHEKELPSLIILDIMLGEENGLDFLPYLDDFCKARRIKKPPALVCSALEETFRVQAAFKLNAQGYIGKSAGETQLLDAIDIVLSGGLYISGGLGGKLAKSYAFYDKFSKREQEIFDLIRKNKTNQQIAEKLGLNIRTVENHVSNIYFKTGAENRQELVIM